MTRLLSTRLFSVERRVYPRSDGTTVERDVVVHPGAVVILPLLADGRIVMIRNFRYTIGRELLELPAGTREPNEEPLETARRELVEETGFRAEVVRPFLEFHTSPGVLTERMHAFIAEGLTAVGQRLEPGERIVVEPLSRGEVRRRLLSGGIEDGKSLAVLGVFLLGVEGDVSRGAS